MERKRSVGVTVFGVFFIFGSIFSWATSSQFIEKYGLVSGLFNRVTSILLLIIAINLLQLKEWSRKSIIYYYIFIICCSIYFIPKMFKVSNHLESERTLAMAVAFLITIIGTAIVIFFFTRPKVKEQFNKKALPT